MRGSDVVRPDPQRSGSGFRTWTAFAIVANMSTRLRQVVLVVTDLERTVEQFRTLFDSGPGDVDPAMSEFDLAHEVLQVGEGSYVEICAPIHADADTAATKFLSRGGDGGYMAVVEIPDAASFRMRMTELDLAMPVQMLHQGNELTQVHPRDFGTLLEADQILSGADWHYPKLEGTPSTTVTSGIAAIDIAVDDPAVIADRWAKAFDVLLHADASSVAFDDAKTVRFVDADGSRNGVVAFDVNATDRSRVGEAHTLGGVDVRFV